MIINAVIHHILNKKVRKQPLDSLDPFKEQHALFDAPHTVVNRNTVDGLETH